MDGIRLIPRELREKLGFPTARFLSEREQSEYEESIKQFSGKAVYSLKGSLKGSNLWKVLYLNQIGIRTATLPELELALENGMYLQNQYEDCREVILRSRKDSYKPNDYLARQLANDLEITKFDNPYIIKNLKIKQDENSYYGLSFIVDTAEVIEAEDFHHKNNGRKFSKVNEDYTVTWDDKASRTFYARDSGLSRVYVNRRLSVKSDEVLLAGSGDDGLVIVVSNAEGAQ